MRPFRAAAVAGSLTVFAIFIGLWYLLAYNLDNNFSPASGKALIVPPPHRMFEGVNETIARDVLVATRITVSTALLGFGGAILVAWSLAIVMSTARWLERSLWPFLVALQAVPIVALVPLIIQLVGVNQRARVLVVALVCFFPLTTNAVDGLNRVNRTQADLFRLYGANRAQTLRKLQIPSAIPTAMSGVRVASAVSVVGAVVADFFFTRGDLGLGATITEYFRSTSPGPMLFAALAASMVGLLLFSISTVVSARLVKVWAPHLQNPRSQD